MRKPKMDIRLNDKKMKTFHLKSEQGKNIQFCHSIQHSTGNPGQRNQAREKNNNKNHLNCKESAKIISIYRLHDFKCRQY